MWTVSLGVNWSPTFQTAGDIPPVAYDSRKTDFASLTSGPGTGIASAGGLVNLQPGKSDTVMRTLLIVTAVLETATGFALAASPSLLVSLLIGSSLDTRTGSVVARLAGTALLTLGLVCWLARNDQQSRATAGPVAAMLFYNVAAVTLLAYACLGLRLCGIVLWPTVVLHAALALWCIACLRTR